MVNYLLVCCSFFCCSWFVVVFFCCSLIPTLKKGMYKNLNISWRPTWASDDELDIGPELDSVGRMSAGDSDAKSQNVTTRVHFGTNCAGIKFTKNQLIHWSEFDSIWPKDENKIHHCVKIMDKMDKFKITDLSLLTEIAKHEGSLQDAQVPMDPVLLQRVVDLDKLLSKDKPQFIKYNNLYQFINGATQNFRYKNHKPWLDQTHGVLHQVVQDIVNKCDGILETFLNKLCDTPSTSLNWSYIKHNQLGSVITSRLVEKNLKLNYSIFPEIDGKEEEILQQPDPHLIKQGKKLVIKFAKWDDNDDVLCYEMYNKYWADMDKGQLSVQSIDSLSKLVSILVIASANKELVIDINQFEFKFLTKILLDVADGINTKTVATNGILTCLNCLKAVLCVSLKATRCIGLEDEIAHGTRDPDTDEIDTSGSFTGIADESISKQDAVQLLDLIMSNFRQVWDVMRGAIDFPQNTDYLINELKKGVEIQTHFDHYVNQVVVFFKLFLYLISKTGPAVICRDQVRISKLTQAIFALPGELLSIKNVIQAFHAQIKSQVAGEVENIDELAGASDDIGDWGSFMWIPRDSHEFLMQFASAITSVDRVGLCAAISTARFEDNQNRIKWDEMPSFSGFIKENASFIDWE